MSILTLSPFYSTLNLYGTFIIHNVTMAQFHIFHTFLCYHSQLRTRGRSQYQSQQASLSTFAPVLALDCTCNMKDQHWNLKDQDWIYFKSDK